MYGLIGGPFPYGLYYSRGLDVLGEKLKNCELDIDVLPTFGWNEWKKIVRDINHLTSDVKVVIYGHSMGANLTTRIAHALKDRPISLIAAFDPTIWYPSYAVGANVSSLIWFHGISRLSIAGHGQIRLKEDFEGTYKKINVPQRHEIIDDNAALHEIVLNAVMSIPRDSHRDEFR